MRKKREAKVEKDQPAIQQTEENSRAMMRPEASIPSDDPSTSLAQRKQERLQDEANRRAMRRKAIKLAEAIVEGHKAFDIELHEWRHFTVASRGAWNDLLTTLLPQVSQEEREEFRDQLLHHGRAHQIVKSEADAFFLLGVALGRKKSRP